MLRPCSGRLIFGDRLPAEPVLGRPVAGFVPAERRRRIEVRRPALPAILGSP
jgi:hypothetical protein